jgi:endoglycosylceramidase
VAPGKPWNFDRTDAQKIANLGLNMVRLGILWQGVEPGTVGPNNPAVCKPGTPGDSGQWNQAVADEYIQHVVDTVNLLAEFHVYTLVDMHQDVYNQNFKGEGAPDWAVCTDGYQLKTLPGRWSNNYASDPLNAAFKHFWRNDVVGNLQGEYDRSWAAVAAALAGNPWVAGYDPINEPFTTSVSPTPGKNIDNELECFYTGSANPGTFLGAPLDCGTDVPANGLIPSVQAVDPKHIIFLEPTIYEVHGQPNFVGAMPYPNLVLNFHAYCGGRSLTGDPYDESKCFTQLDRRFLHRMVQVAQNPSSYQPQGLPLFLSEFGATQSAALVGAASAEANQLKTGWAYWAWKYYNDPTGSSNEALVTPNGKFNPQAAALRQTYPEAVAGTPIDVLTDVKAGSLLLKYESDPNITAPTLISVPVKHYFPNGYCAEVTGAKLISAPDAPTVEVENNPTVPRKVQVAIFKGDCD